MFWNESERDKGSSQGRDATRTRARGSNKWAANGDFEPAATVLSLQSRCNIMVCARGIDDRKADPSKMLNIMAEPGTGTHGQGVPRCRVCVTLHDHYEFVPKAPTATGARHHDTTLC